MRGAHLSQTEKINAAQQIQQKQQEEKETSSFRNRRVILTLQNPSASINSLFIRNKINEALHRAGEKKVLVATVALSQSAKSVVITTTQDSSAEHLLSLQKKWQHLLPFKAIKKDEKWFKVVAHGLSTTVFNTAEGLQLLKDEVETFNKEFKLASLPQWLTTEANRKSKRHASAVLSFKTEEEARKAIRKRLQIGGVSIKIAAFKTCKPTNQCIKCQTFGHQANNCTKEVRCRICAGLHKTVEHQCRLCRTGEKGKKCVHTIVKCVNCRGEHEADSQSCSVYRALEPFSSTADPLSQSN